MLQSSKTNGWIFFLKRVLIKESFTIISNPPKPNPHSLTTCETDGALNSFDLHMAARNDTMDKHDWSQATSRYTPRRTHVHKPMAQLFLHS